MACIKVWAAGGGLESCSEGECSRNGARRIFTCAVVGVNLVSASAHAVDLRTIMSGLRIVEDMLQYTELDINHRF